MHPEVLQHVEDGLEPEVLHSALTVLVQGQTEVLREDSEVKGQQRKSFLLNLISIFYIRVNFRF